MCKESNYKMLVKTINNSIKKYGVAVVLRKNEQGKYDVGYEMIQSRRMTWTAKNETLTNLGDAINTAWDAAERKGKEQTKMFYVVSAVTTSESEYDANGHCSSSVFDTLDKAKEKMAEIAQAEKDYCETDEREYEVLEDDDIEFRMGWCDNTEQLRITIAEVVLNY